MEEIKRLVAFCETDTPQEGYDMKVMSKIAKKYQNLDNARVVKLYPVRSVAYEDSRYRVFACPFNGQEIDEQTLQEIKSLVDQLEVGHIRYDSVQSSGYDYYIFNEGDGRHIIPDEDRDAMMEISDHFDGIVLFTKMVLSSKKVSQLDCNYAVIGVKKQPNEYQIEVIPNSAIGKNGRQGTYEGGAQQLFKVEIPDAQPESPAQSKYKLAVQILSAIITIGFLIWFYLSK